MRHPRQKVCLRGDKGFLYVEAVYNFAGELMSNREVLHTLRDSGGRGPLKFKVTHYLKHSQ